MVMAGPQDDIKGLCSAAWVGSPQPSSLSFFMVIFIQALGTCLCLAVRPQIQQYVGQKLMSLWSRTSRQLLDCFETAYGALGDASQEHVCNAGCCSLGSWLLLWKFWSVVLSKVLSRLCFTLSMAELPVTGRAVKWDWLVLSSDGHAEGHFPLPAPARFYSIDAMPSACNEGFRYGLVPRPWCL